MNCLAVGYPTLNAARTVGSGVNPADFRPERVVMLRSRQQNAAKTRAHVEAFRSGQAQHGLRQIGLEPIKHRLAPTRGHTTGDALDNSADGVPGFAHFFDEPNHLFSRVWVGAADNICFHITRLDLFRINLSDNRLDLFNASENLYLVLLAQNLFGNCSGRNPPDRLTRAGPSAAGPGADSEFSLIRVIRVRRPKLGGHFGIGFGPEILVADPHANRGSECLALERAGKDLDAIQFFAWGNDFRLAGPAPVQIRLNVG